MKRLHRYLLVAVTTSIVCITMYQEHRENVKKRKSLDSVEFQKMLAAKHAIRSINNSPKQSIAVATNEKPQTEIKTKREEYDAKKSMMENAVYTRDQCSKLTGKARHYLRSDFTRSFRSKTLVRRHSQSLLFTPIPKVGFTTWTQIFYSNLGKSNQLGRGSRWAWDIDYKEIGMAAWELKDIISHQHKFKDKILFVRNPYDRLVSAYLNKAVHAEGYYSKRLHLPCSWLTLEYKRILTFDEFVDCVIEKAKSHDSNLATRKGGIYLDIHWAPQVHLAMPCTTNYTLISKYEHFRDDVEFTVRYLKLNATIPVRNKSTKWKDKPLSYWYNMLNEEQMLAIKQLYTHDFQLFKFNSTPPT